MSASPHTFRHARSIDRSVATRLISALANEQQAGDVYECHSHDRAQLLYASVGVMSVLTPDGGFVVPPQRALWLPARTQHEVHFRSRTSVRTLYIEPHAHARLPRQCRIIEVSELLRALILEAVNLRGGYEVARREEHIMELIPLEIVAMPATPLHAPMPSEERLARVCRAIFRQPSLEKGLDECARSAGVSARTLCRLFRRETGMSFAAWRQHIRLLEAMSRLAVGHAVGTVAFDVGYHSASAFTAMFRRAFGTTPKQYFSTHKDSPAVSRPLAAARRP